MSDGIKAAREQLFETDKTPKRAPARVERREREAVARETQRLQDQEAALKAWPERLMKNLERAGKQGWSFYVTNSRFVVDARTNWGMEELRFGYTPVGRFELWNQDNDWYAMDELERYLNDAEEAEREAQRLAQVRAGALNKLTAEEREALGL